MENQNLEVSQDPGRWTAPPHWSPGGRSVTAVGEVAHDIRGMLTVVKGYAELLKDESERASSTSSRTFCNKILHACSLMQDMVENCLDLTCIESGRLVPKPQKIDLVSFLEETVSSLSLRARAKEITLVIDLARPLPVIYTDAGFLERILCNLISNAIKFSPPHSTVQLLAGPVRSWVQLEVSDQGPGLSLDEVPYLFEAYRRGSARPTGGEKSTGLGLTIVKELTAALGGSVTVRSQPGCGATFVITLPYP